jgi:hypothetical protein
MFISPHVLLAEHPPSGQSSHTRSRRWVFVYIPRPTADAHHGDRRPGDQWYWRADFVDAIPDEPRPGVLRNF